MLITLDKAKEKILAGKTLMIAGDQSLLSKLPKGTWIGGSIPYFIAENGGVFSKDKVFVTELDSQVFSNAQAVSYTVQSIPSIAKDASDDQVTFLILPFGSEIQLEYAKKGPEYPEMFLKPIVGWVSGIALDEIGKVKATVVNGVTGEVFTDRAIALRASLPKGKQAKIGIVNIFNQGSGDEIEFLDESFDVKDVLVNGTKTNFYDYIAAKKIDVKLPLVGDFAGAKVNVSFMSLDEKSKIVHLYAPVFKNVVYKVASSVGNYSQAFEKALKGIDNKTVTFSCNCILNYLYGELEGKKTGTATGPITFGEIAYQLVNQTFVYVEV